MAFVPTMRVCAVSRVRHVAVAVQARRHNGVVGFLRRVHGVIHVLLMSGVIHVLLMPGMFIVLGYMFVLHTVLLVPPSSYT
jgi:hypothetical protein